MQGSLFKYVPYRKFPARNNIISVNGIPFGQDGNLTRWCSRMCWSCAMRGSSIDAACVAHRISWSRCSRPLPRGHDYLFKRDAYERAGVREYWLVHPADRLLTCYRLVDGRYGEPVMQELVGTTPVSVLPGVVIAWDHLVSRLPKPDL